MMRTCLLLHCLSLGFAGALHAQNKVSDQLGWIDSETGHRVIRVSNVAYSNLPYFTANSISSDQRFMAYSSPRGIHILNLNNFESALLIKRGMRDLWFVGAARTSNRIFYLSALSGDEHAMLKSIDIDSRQVTVHATLPRSYRIESINADDSLAVGVAEDEDSVPGRQYRNKAEALYARFGEKRPMSLFTVNLKTGQISHIYRSTDWLSHPQFSPVDPSIIMYSLEGPWHLLDRIWLINSDGSDRRLVHQRTMDMEIVGHEFWSKDGKMVLYDWQYPKGRTFFLAANQIASGRRLAFPLKSDEWSIHYNSSNDPNVFVGDGADKRQVARSADSAYIYLYRITENAADGSRLNNWTTGTVRTEKLVDLRGHDYKLEPNARLTPDGKWALFRSNMFGPPAIFAVEVKKAVASNGRRTSTYELSKQLVREYRDMLMLGQKNK